MQIFGYDSNEIICSARAHDFGSSLVTAIVCCSFAFTGVSILSTDTQAIIVLLMLGRLVDVDGVVLLGNFWRK